MNKQEQTRQDYFKKFDAIRAAQVQSRLNPLPSAYSYPVYIYQSSFYRFYPNKTYIGTYVRDAEHWADKCCLSWFDIELDEALKEKIIETNKIWIRKTYKEVQND